MVLGGLRRSKTASYHTGHCATIYGVGTVMRRRATILYRTSAAIFTRYAPGAGFAPVYTERIVLLAGEGGRRGIQTEEGGTHGRLRVRFPNAFRVRPQRRKQGRSHVG